MKLVVFLVASLFSTAFAQVKNERLEGILKQSKLTWKQYQTVHFNLFVEQDQYADHTIDFVKNKLASERNEIINFLDDQNFIDTANIVIVDTKEKVKRILGFEAQGFAIPENDIIVFLYSPDYSLAARHELTHYYAFHAWGKPADNWFSEGLAVYNDNRWSGYQIDSLAKHLKDADKLFRLSSFSKQFYSLDPMIAYPQIGSFTGFLLKKYGKSKLKQLWIGGFRQIKKIYGKSQKELEQQWLTDLDNIRNNIIDYNRHLK